MCLRAFYLLHPILTVSSATEKVLCCLEALACGIFSLLNLPMPAGRRTCFLQTLEAPADFTILQVLAKCEHTPHTWALGIIAHHEIHSLQTST